MQKITAIKLGLNPILMASANTTGGVMGKMIDAQSIVVAAAATGEGGREGELLRAVFWHSIVLALIVGAIVWVYAHLLPGMVVGDQGRLEAGRTVHRVAFAGLRDESRANEPAQRLSPWPVARPRERVMEIAGRESRAVGPPGP